MYILHHFLRLLSLHYHLSLSLFRSMGWDGRWMHQNIKYKLNTKKGQTSLSDLEEAATYSPTALCSTIGVNGLNFSVRNGKRWDPIAIAT